MRSSLLLIFVIILFGCQPKLKNNTPEEFAMSIIQTLKSGDTVRVWKELFSMPSDSLDAKSDALREVYHNIFADESKYKDYINSQKKLYKEFLIESEKLKIEWKNIEFKETTYRVDYHDEFDAFAYRDFYIYFIYKGEEYRFEIENSTKIKDKVKDFILKNLLNIKKEEERLKNENYAPSSVYISNQYNWKYKYSDLKRFTEFYINLINNSNNDLDYVRYKIKLLKPTSWGTKTEIFSKTFEHNSKIFKGDRERIRINELTDFYLDVDVSDEDSFFMESEIIDVLPHPTFQR